MTDGGPPSLPASRRPALGLRLALAFISVALAAVALVAGLPQPPDDHAAGGRLRP